MLKGPTFYLWRNAAYPIPGHIEFLQLGQVAYGGRHTLEVVAAQSEDAESHQAADVLRQLSEQIVGHVQDTEVLEGVDGYRDCLWNINYPIPACFLQ